MPSVGTNPWPSQLVGVDCTGPDRIPCTKSSHRVMPVHTNKGGLLRESPTGRSRHNQHKHVSASCNCLVLLCNSAPFSLIAYVVYGVSLFKIMRQNKNFPPNSLYHIFSVFVWVLTWAVSARSWERCLSKYSSLRAASNSVCLDEHSSQSSLCLSSLSWMTNKHRLLLDEA